MFFSFMNSLISFISFLQMGSIGAGAAEATDGQDNLGPDPGQQNPPNHSVFKPGMGPQDFGTAYRPYHDGGRPSFYMDRSAEKKQVEEVWVLFASFKDSIMLFQFLYISYLCLVIYYSRQKIWI